MSIQTSSKIAETLEEFLKGFRDKTGQLKYRARISSMIQTDSRSIIIDYNDVLEYDIEIANMLISDPDRILTPFNNSAYQILKNEAATLAERIRSTIRVRIRDIPEVVPLREINSEHLNKFVAITGMAVRTSELKPQALEAAFKCRKCGNITIEIQEAVALVQPQRCGECGEVKSFDLDDKETTFIDYQVIRLQELPEELPPGQLPQSYDVDLTGDVVNETRPGDRVTLTGIVRSEPEYSTGTGKLRTFTTRIEGNYCETMRKEVGEVTFTSEDEPLIKSTASQTNAYERLIESIAPEIFGNDTQKEALLLQAVGSPQKTLPDGSIIRGDMNVLFVGDPGTAKSEFLKYSSKIAPRGLYTSGRGSTAAGLTAAVVREKNGMMMLEAGAVVLADQGIACIDEFDKMRTEDRNALHECMEQQTCSVAKGGIVATLNARTSILAAANPVLGKYDTYKNITENVNLPVPLLTRFDLIFVMRDIPDKNIDESLARHILETHRKVDYVTQPPVSFDLLRKYLAYARNIEPVLTKEAENLLVNYYIKMRGIGSENMITVTPRQLEGLVRLSTARARIMLREQVLEEDALRAISLMDRMLETVGVDVRTGKVDPGVFHGRPSSDQAILTKSIEVFNSLTGTERKAVDEKILIDEIIAKLKISEDEAKRAIKLMYDSGTIFEVKKGSWRRL